MIRNVTFGPPFMVTTSGGCPSYGSPGTVRWNPNTGGLEADLNGMWQSVEQTVHLTLDTRTTEVLEWAKNKMAKEKEIEELAEQYPMVKDLKEKLDIMVTLVKDYN